MSYIILENANRKYGLTPDLRVLDLGSANHPEVGAWGSPAGVATNGAEMAPNRVECRLADGTRFDAAVDYNFTPWTNQLTVSVDGGQTKLSLPGKIVIDDDYDVSFIVHVVENNQPKSLKQALTIDCKIVVADDLASLKLELEEEDGGKKTIAIEGIAGFRSFEPDHSGINEDALYFKAATIAANAIIDADIRFIGTWSLDRKNGAATFTVEASGNIDKPTLELKFGAQFGVVDGGLEVQVTDGQITRAAFVIGGVVEKPSGTSRWKISLGHSGNAYELSVNFSGKHLIAKEGNNLYRGIIEFSGDATVHVVDGTGGGPQLKASLKLKAKWTLDSTDASLDFEVAVTMPNGDAPKIALNGSFTWNGKSLTFKVATQDGGFSFEVELKTGNLYLYIKVIFGPNGEISLDLVARYTWVIERQRTVRGEVKTAPRGKLADIVA